MRYLSIRYSWLLWALLVGGCQSPFAQNHSPSAVTRADLKAQNDQLLRQNQQQLQQIDQLNRQLANLRSFSEERLARLVRVEAIEFGRFTRPYDDDNDGVDDGINVYLVLRDQQGDSIKAAGELTLELWDLAAADHPQQLGRWSFGFEEFADHWLSGLMADHYKFTLPLAPSAQSSQANLTLKLLFRDALTGQEFEIQKMLPVHRAPAPLETPNLPE